MFQKTKNKQTKKMSKHLPACVCLFFLEQNHTTSPQMLTWIPGLFTIPIFSLLTCTEIDDLNTNILIFQYQNFHN